MTQLIHKTGDIFSTTAKAIGHGVNVHGVMGHGIAVQFRDRFPQMYEEYRTLCKSGELQPGGLYTYQYMTHPPLYVYNIASQDAPGRNARYDWLIGGVCEAMIHADSHGIDRIALPRIGSGVGGLDQDLVERSLRILAEMLPVDIELWTLPRAS